MIIHRTPQFQIYFGDTADSISKKDHCIPTAMPLVNHEKFKPVADRLEIQHLAFLNQTHSTDGFILEKEIPAFNKDGDYLITAQKNIGIGVMTADCLPIIYYDKKNHCAAVAHAGWRGSVGGIASKTIGTMQEIYNTGIDDIQIFLGPSAKQCCYVVDEKFVMNIKDFTLQVIERNRHGALCFDLPGLNILQLAQLGIDKKNIHTNYNFCTICDHRFFSYRRQAENSGRQMSIISLF